MHHPAAARATIRTAPVAVSIAAIGCLVAGCLKVESVLNLKPDTSGSVVINYSVSEDAVQRMKALTRLRNQFDAITSNPAPTNNTLADMFLMPEETALRAEFKRHEQSGISLDQLKIRSTDNWRHVQMTISFKRLADAARSELFAEYGFTLVKNTKGDYIMFRDKADVEDTVPAADASSSKMIAPLLQGFRVDLKVNVPGKIIQSNAHRESLTTANWSFDYDQDKNALVNIQKQQFKIQFEGKDINLPTIMFPRHSPGK